MDSDEDVFGFEEEASCFENGLSQTGSNRKMSREQELWKNWKCAVEKNKGKLKESTATEVLRMGFGCDSEIDLDSDNNFWTYIAYRPDKIHKLAELRYENRYEVPKEISDFFTSENYYLWDNCSISYNENSEERLKEALRFLVAPFVGFATVALENLYVFVDTDTFQSMKEKMKFSPALSQLLVTSLAECKWPRLMEFLKHLKKCREYFLLRAIRLSFEGAWVADLPPQCITKFCVPGQVRAFVRSRSVSKIENALKDGLNTERWLLIHGLSGSGKTSAAVNLSHKIADNIGMTVVWLDFGGKDSESILNDICIRLADISDQRELVSTKFSPNVVLSRIFNLRKMIKTCYILDDVRQEHDSILNHFHKCDHLVITSHFRDLKLRPSLDRTLEPVAADEPLKEDEAWEMARRLSNAEKAEELRKLPNAESEIKTILECISFSPMMTVMVFAKIFAEENQWHDKYFEKFHDKITNECIKCIKGQVHKCTNLFSVLSPFVEELDERLHERFHSLCFAPWGARLSDNMMSKIWKCSDVEALESLEELYNRSLLKTMDFDKDDSKYHFFWLHDSVYDLLGVKVEEMQKDAACNIQDQTYWKNRFLESLKDHIDDIHQNESIFFRYYVRICFEVDRKDLALLALTSIRYLLHRWNLIRVKDLWQDFHALEQFVSSSETHHSQLAAVSAFKDLMREITFCAECREIEDLVRQALLFQRPPFITDQLRAICKELKIDFFWQSLQQDIDEKAVFFSECSRSNWRSKGESDLKSFSTSHTGELLIAARDVVAVSEKRMSKMEVSVVAAGWVSNEDHFLVITENKCLLFQWQKANTSKRKNSRIPDSLAKGQNDGITWGQFTDLLCEKPLPEVLSQVEFSTNEFAVCKSHESGIKIINVITANKDLEVVDRDLDVSGSIWAMDAREGCVALLCRHHTTHFTYTLHVYEIDSQSVTEVPEVLVSGACFKLLQQNQLLIGSFAGQRRSGKNVFVWDWKERVEKKARIWLDFDADEAEIHKVDVTEDLEFVGLLSRSVLLRVFNFSSGGVIFDSNHRHLKDPLAFVISENSYDRELFVATNEAIISFNCEEGVRIAKAVPVSTKQVFSLQWWPSLKEWAVLWLDEARHSFFLSTLPSERLLWQEKNGLYKDFVRFCINENNGSISHFLVGSCDMRLIIAINDQLLLVSLSGDLKSSVCGELWKLAEITDVSCCSSFWMLVDAPRGHKHRLYLRHGEKWKKCMNLEPHERATPCCHYLLIFGSHTLKFFHLKKDKMLCVPKSKNLVLENVKAWKYWEDEKQCIVLFKDGSLKLLSLSNEGDVTERRNQKVYFNLPSFNFPDSNSFLEFVGLFPTHKQDFEINVNFGKSDVMAKVSDRNNACVCGSRNSELLYFLNETCCFEIGKNGKRKDVINDKCLTSVFPNLCTTGISDGDDVLLLWNQKEDDVRIAEVFAMKRQSVNLLQSSSRITTEHCCQFSAFHGRFSRRFVYILVAAIVAGFAYLFASQRKFFE